MGRLATRLLSLTRALRVVEWKAYVGLAMYGALLPRRPWPDALRPLPLVLAATLLYMAASYLINNVYDVGSDRVNPRKARRNPFAAGSAPRSLGLAAGLASCAAGLFLAALAGLPALASYAAGLALSLAYSAPPLRLKGRPPLDLVSHSVFFGVALVLWGFYASGGERLSLTALAAIALYSVALELRNELEDLEADGASGCRTTAVALGREASQRLLWAVLLSFAALASASLYVANPVAGALLAASALAIALADASAGAKLRAMDACAIAYCLATLVT